ncbi:MAG: hypothetical protein NDI60_06390 [Elusimicrobiales bacterium]|nr:hypothetical protein [Elusimicrobiales bacterium]
MDNKDGKKKESIDEILSDLNGLLNKMPSILDGIKMPEMKPVEFSAAPEEKKPEPKTPQLPPDADKTVVLEAFSGLPEGAASPEPAPAADSADKTLIIENFSPAPEGGQLPEEEKLVPQSLGDFMFGEDEQLSPAAGAAPEAAAASKEEPISLPEFQAPEPEVRPAAVSQDASQFESTRDFGGIPDIDALIQLSDGGAPKPAPAPAPAAEAQAQAPAAAPEPSLDELAEFEKQLEAAAPRGEAMDSKPEEEKPEVQPAREPELVIEPSAKPGLDFESLTIEPEGQPAAAEGTPEPEAAVPAQGIELEPAIQAAAEPAAEAAETLQLEPAPKFGASPAEAETLQLEPSLGAAAQPQPAAEGQEQTLTVGQPDNGLVMESASAGLSAAAQPSGDQTLVVPPPSGDEDKTVIFEAGAAPGITSRSQAGDLAGLAERSVPEGIPAERTRAIAFLYAPEDKALCATVLSELDAICLKSPQTPMFIKRASVKECDPEVNANYVLQSVTDSGAQGMVCVGSIPQEKIYEMENAFTSSGGFFRHYDSAAFTHSAALDLVMDLILR